MARSFIYCIVFFCIFTTGSLAYSDVVYSTFGPNYSHNLQSGFIIGTPDERTQKIQVSAPFTIAMDTVLDSLAFAAYYWSGINQLRANLETSDASGLPSGNVVETFSFTNLAPTSTVYAANSSMHPLLEASNRYWVVLTADDLLNTDMVWNDNDQGIRVGYALSSSATNFLWQFNPTGNSPAFDVNGTPVPAPSTWLLLGMGLAGVGVYRISNRARA